jgi:hypothetical protein
MNDYKVRILKKFEDEYGNEYPTTGGKTGYDASVYYDDDNEFNEEVERLIMEDQQEQFIEKDKFDCYSEN